MKFAPKPGGPGKNCAPPTAQILSFQAGRTKSGEDNLFFPPKTHPPFSLMDDSHLKLLAFDLLSLTSSSSDPPTFSRKGMPVSRAESVGVITSRDHKPWKFLKFTLDDGSGCISCILWLNHLSSPYFSCRDSGSVAVLADVARRFAAKIQIGKVARVRGRISSNREEVQMTMSDGGIERDPNLEILHWLDCLRLARQCYDGLNRTSN